MGKSTARWTWYRLALICVAAYFASTRYVRADVPEAQRAAARELGTVGMEAYFDKNYARAEDDLDRAYRLYPTPTLGLWSARASIQLGHWVRAAERLREVQFASAAIGDNDAQRQAQTDAANELAGLAPRIPRLIIVVDGASPDHVTIEVDGAPFERKLIGIAHPSDPGKHHIVGTFREQRVELEIELQPGASEVARVEFKSEAPLIEIAPVSVAAAPEVRDPLQLRAAAAEPPANKLRIASIVSLSLGGVGLATSLVTTLLANSKLDACRQRDGEYFCSDREADAYETFRTTATISFYGGAAFGGAGLLLWFLQPSADKQKTVSLAARPTGADVLVKF